MRCFSEKLAEEIGIQEAIVLSQAHYWTARATVIHEGSKWFWHSIEDWEADFPFWGRATIYRTLRRLEDINSLFRTRGISSRVGNRVPFYRVNYDCPRVIIMLDDYSARSHIDTARSHFDTDHSHFDTDHSQTDTRNPTIPLAQAALGPSHILPKNNHTLPNPQGWLMGLEEKRKFEINRFLDDRVQTAQGIKNPDAFRQSLLKKIYLGELDVPEVDDTVYEMVCSFRKGFDHD